MKTLPDITQYYSNESSEPLRHSYKRKPLEVEIEILGECMICESLLTSECEIVVGDGEIFCSEYHFKEYLKMKEDDEL